MDHNIELSGNIIKLLPLEEIHFEKLLEAASNPEIWELTSVDYSDRDIFFTNNSQALRDKKNGLVFPFVILDQRTGEIIGTTRFLDISETDKKLEIGVTWIKKEYWGSAVNLECKYLLMEYSFEVLKFNRIQLRAKADNTRSRKAIENIGAKLEGIFRKDKIQPNGLTRNTAFYSVIDTDWPDVKRLLIQRLNQKSKS